MRRRTLWWTIGVVAFVVITLTAVFVFTRITPANPLSWWWFFGTLMFEVIVGAITGAIFLISRLKRPQLPEVRLNPKDAKERAIYEIKYNPDNPDNFRVDKQKIVHEGKSNTPILHLSGIGTELNQRIDVLIPLNNPKFQMTDMRNAVDTEVKEARRLLAEIPSHEIEEETVVGVDEYGRPLQRTTKRKVSEAEKQLEQEKKEAELQNVF